MVCAIIPIAESLPCWDVNIIYRPLRSSYIWIYCTRRIHFPHTFLNLTFFSAATDPSRLLSSTHGPYLNCFPVSSYGIGINTLIELHLTESASSAIAALSKMHPHHLLSRVLLAGGVPAMAVPLAQLSMSTLPLPLPLPDLFALCSLPSSASFRTCLSCSSLDSHATPLPHISRYPLAETS